MRLHVLQRQREPHPLQIRPHMLRHPVVVVARVHAAPPASSIHYAERYAPVPNSSFPRFAAAAFPASPYAAIPAIPYRAQACSNARAQKPSCVGALPIAVIHVHVPAHAGRMSRLLAPGVARPSRRQGRRSRSTRRQGRRVPHSVSQPMPPQSRSEHGIAPRRHGLSNSVAPAARKRSASAATGASVPLSPSAPLRARSGRSRSLRGHCAGSASPLSGSCSAGRRRTRSAPIAANHGLRRGLMPTPLSFRLARRRCRSQPALTHAPFVALPFFSCREERAATAPGYRAPRTPSRLSFAEKGAREPTPSARRPSSRSAPRRSSGRCRPVCRPATSRRGRGHTP